MTTVKVELGERSYPIEIAQGALDRLGTVVAGALSASSAFVITDANVGPLYAGRAEASLKAAGIDCRIIEHPLGEKRKDLHTIGELYDRVFEAGIDRHACIVALGGGVVGDMAGYVAATILRGVACVQVPTTLLAQVDSSVGGKTGVNHQVAGKNMIGAFHQPSAVAIDPDVLSTLDDRQLKAGIAEIVKTAVIWDSELFDRLEANPDGLLSLDPEFVIETVAACCRIKAEVVSRDEREGGLRAILNFGHTVAHALEIDSGYGTLLHGEAVAVGMVAAGRLGARLGMWPDGDAKRLEGLLDSFGLPTRHKPHEPGRVLALMRRDKKASKGELRMVLPVGVGQVETRGEIDEEALLEVLREIL